MRVKLGQIPFVRILAPFIVGIITEFYFPSHSFFFYTGIFSLLFIFIWYWRENSKSPEYKFRWVSGALLGIFLFSSGYCITLLRTPSEKINYVGNAIREDKDSMVITLVSIPQEKQKTYKATAEINGIISKGVLIKTTGNALLYFHKDSNSKTLNYGDELIVNSRLQEIEPPGNPDEFDYKQFLQTQGINYECFVSDYTYSKSGISGSNFLLHFANSSRKKLATLLNEKIGGNEGEVASAILLGYRDDLSRSISQSFADSGVVHVICVAGLHVGIIFLLLNYIIVFPSKYKHGKLLSVLIILILLWLYALFTGLATPVLRATIMFSLLTIGNHFRKYTNTVNTLAASAFIMLLFDPFSLADTGFQLSYISVLGIVIIYKPLLSIFNPESFIVRKIWELACVSFSAQLAVLPLTIFYFHQFPNYFIITNILVVPLLTVVIFLGIFYFLVSWIPGISSAVVWVLQKVLLLMNTIVSGTSHLPLAVTKGISVTSFESILLYLCIIFILIYISSRKYYLLFSGLSLLVIFISIQAGKKIIHSNQQLFAVYDVPGKSAVTFISGRHSVMPFGRLDSADINMHIQDNWWKLGVKDNFQTPNNIDTIMLSAGLMIENQFAQFNNFKYAFIRKNSDLISGANKLNLHTIILSGGYDLDMLSLKNAFNFDILIFDSSVPDYKLKKWEEECKQLNLRYYEVRAQGAYMENC